MHEPWDWCAKIGASHMDQSIYVEEFISFHDSILTKYLFQNVRKNSRIKIQTLYSLMFQPNLGYKNEAESLIDSA